MPAPQERGASNPTLASLSQNPSDQTTLADPDCLLYRLRE